MTLSNQGISANVFWYEIKNHAKNIDLDEFVVMPNHIHSILGLNNATGDGNHPKTSDKNGFKIRVEIHCHLL